MAALLRKVVGDTQGWFNKAVVNKVFVADCQLLFSSLFFGIGFAGQKEAQLEGMAPLFFNALRYGLSALFLVTLLPLISSNHEKADTDLLPTSVNQININNKEKESLLPGGLASRSHEAAFGSPPIKAPSTDSTNSSVGGGGVGGASGSEGGNSVPQSAVAEKIGKYLSQYPDFHRTLILGTVLAFFNFSASSFQQIGIDHISASESAFLTGFYIVFTPLLQLVFPILTAHKPKLSTWMAVFMSMCGLFVISGSSYSKLKLGKGEIYTLFAAFWWSLFILLIDIGTDIVDSIHLTVVNLCATSLFSLIASYVLEFNDWSFAHIIISWKMILFLGAVECFGFTLGAMGQTFAPAHHAAVIYGSEIVWATIGGFFLVNETLSYKEWVGCILMVASTVCAKVEVDTLCLRTIKKHTSFA